MLRKFKKLILKFISHFYYRKGYSIRKSSMWCRKKYSSILRDKNFSLREKFWAYRKGFMPLQIKLFGINKGNVDQFISEKDYHYIYPLNGKYIKWLSDKVTVRSMLKPFSNYLVPCYFQISRRDGEPFVIPMADLDGEYSNDLQGVKTLLREKKVVEICRSKGRRSLLLSYKEGAYFVNGKEISAEKLELLITKFSGISVIRAHVVPHENFRTEKNYPAFLRISVFNEMGNNPKIGRATVDISEGYVDENMDDFEDVSDEEISKAVRQYFRDNQQLHIYANVDIETGRYSKGQAIVEDSVEYFETNPTNGKRIEGEIPHWNDLKEFINKLCRFMPQLEFFGITFIITDEGFKINRFMNMPTYPKIEPFDKEITAYLKKKVEEKKEAYKTFRAKFRRSFKLTRSRSRKLFARLFYPKGLIPYLSTYWIRDVLSDFIRNGDVSFGTKMWAYRHGFLSYRIPQYGITKENHLNFISDFEYKWLRHINSHYRIWMEDKITVKYIASEYNECFPGYYYYTSKRDDINKIIPMMDCPEGYGNSFEDVFKLVREKGILALKPVSGSHGDGFYKFWYEEGKYYLNFDEATREEVLSILQNVKNQYLITEYIDMHPQLKAIYPGAVNTIRMVVFKKDGRTPEIGNAYMRFGSKRTGAVDNMGAGGMFAKLDVDTGRYYDAKIIEDNSIRPCPKHPDTGVLIEGIIPNWERVKELVLNVAEGIPQLEYFGFDLAVTADGIKFPEINRFPDFPKIETLSPKTIDYLLYKLDAKKKRYGYDIRRPVRLINLPKR